MIGMAGHQRGSAIELFGEYEAHQHVRQRQRTQRPALVGAREHVRRMAVGAADEEGDIATAHPPLLELLGKFLAGPRLAAPVEGYHVDIPGKRCEDGCAFVERGAHIITPLAAYAGLDLDEFERE